MQNTGLVKDWLRDFLEQNWPAFAGSDWSRDGRDCATAWKEWLNALIEVKAQRGEAELAAELTAARRDGQVLDSPGAWLSCIVAEIKSIRAAAPGPGALSERQGASDASRDCPHCGGEGMAMVDHPPGRVAAHCVCPMGRWMRGRTAQDMIRRIPDFADHLRDRSEQAAAALREFYDLGWEFRWIEDESQFRTYPVRPDAPEKVSRELSNRCRELRREIYDLLGHPIEAEEVMDMNQFRDADGKFHWRPMVEAIAERGAIKS